jgi:hypothetical protein
VPRAVAFVIRAGAAQLMPPPALPRLWPDSVASYKTPNLWSRAIHDSPQRFDKIRFRSRYASDIPVAISGDRARLAVCAEPIPLHRHAGIAGFPDRFGFGIADPDGNDWRAAGE